MDINFIVCWETGVVFNGMGCREIDVEFQGVVCGAICL